MTFAAVGDYALGLSVLASAAGLLSAMATRMLARPWLHRLTVAAICMVAVFLTIASAALIAAILGDRFDLAYVAGHSERLLPWAYKLAAFWAGQEGSILLWGWLIAVVSSIAALQRRLTSPADRTHVAMVLLVVCGFFSVMLLFAANPFQLGEIVPADGQGLNPLLQDPAMVAHPPLLFLGYACFTVPLALCLGGLLGGTCDRQWAARMRKWVLAAWLFLTVGILLGAKWAYVELGWGGYWAWDPVENASLLPWLTATPLLHSLLVQQRLGMLKKTSAALACLTFLLCIFATYLTRSGVISSVHSFPESPVGWGFLLFLLAGIAFCAVVLAGRRRLLADGQPMKRLLSLEGAILGATALCVVMMLVVMVGTIYPLISKPLTGKAVTLGPEFYNTIVLPMGIALAALMGLGPLLSGQPRTLLLRLILPALVALAAAGLTATRWDPPRASMLFCAAVAAFVATAILQEFIASLLRRRRTGQGLPKFLAAQVGRYGAWLAHAGVAMLVVGVAGSSLYNVQKDMVLEPTRPARLASYDLALDKLREVTGPNYRAVEAVIHVREPGGGPAEEPLLPQRRQYNRGTQVHSQVAILSRLNQDLYLVLHSWKNEGEQVTVQAIVNPLVNWIWLGGLAMAAGSLVCIVLRRRTSAGEQEIPAAAAETQPPACRCSERN